MQMEIKHITLGINNKTHNVNSETNNNKSTPFNNASRHIHACVHTVIKIKAPADIHKIKEKEKE